MVLSDRYRILRKLGDGGMGSVYEGEHVSIKRRVAIKILHAQFAQKPEIVARFHREAEAANAIGHPNIVEVTDMGRFPDGTAFMVLEFLNGRDWARDIESEGPQPLAKVVHIFAQVCDALAAAHAKGIVHRDLKPENIYLIERGGDRNFAKVLDFGISKISDPANENRSLTQTGTALGTPYYMAPEQCQGKKDLDARADIYSLGVILFQALTRQYPFDDESYPMLVLKICTEPPPPLARFRPDLPHELHAILERMLAKDRNHRFASVSEVRAALEPFRHFADTPVVVASAPSTASQAPSVLEARVSKPASTPTGTAFLPGTPAEPIASDPSLPAVTPARRSSSTALAVVIALCVLVVAGGSFGAALAFGVFEEPRPSVQGDRAQADPDPPPRTAAQPRPVDEPTPPAPPEPTPTTVAVPTTPPEPVAPAAPETVRVHVEVTGPAVAEVYVDGTLRGSSPVTVHLPRDATPTLHAIEARAEGWHAPAQQVTLQEPVDRTIAMERASGRRRDPRVTPMPVGTPGTTPIQSSSSRGESLVQPSTVLPPSPPSNRGGLVGRDQIGL